MVVGFYEGVEDSVLHALCAQSMVSFVFLVFLKRCNLEAMSVLELLRAVKTTSRRPQARLKHLVT